MKRRKSMKRRKRLRLPKSSADSTSIAKWPYLPLLVLLGLSLLIAVMRLRTYNEPFERDITSHAVIAHEILAGRELYSDLWDSKPPGIFATYAIADALIGYGPQSVYFLGVMAAVITLFGVYWAGSAYGGKAGGLWAATFWTFICSDMWLWANQPNIEVFLNASLVWAFALIVRAGGEKLELKRWLIIGGLFALATLYKPQAIVFAVFLAIFHIALPPRHKGRKLALLQICIVAIVGAAVWVAVLAYFALTDRLMIFYQTVFEYSRWYAKSRGGNFFTNILEGFSLKRFFPVYMKSTPVLGIFAAVGIVFGLWKGSRRNWLLMLAFALAAQFAIALPGRFYGHYYQLWLGPFVIGSAWAVTTLGPKDKPGPTLVRYMAGAVGLIILLCSTLPQYKFSADEWSVKKITPQFVISKRVVMEVDKLLERGETLYVWGQNHEFYFWAKRKPPTGLIWSTDLMDNPLAEKHTARALEDLKRERPEIFVVNIAQFTPPQEHPVIAWVSKHYVPLPGHDPKRYTWLGRPFFLILIRKDGKLAARLGV